MEKIYTVREACEVSGKAESTVRNAMSAGRLKFSKDEAGRVTITEADLNEWIELSRRSTAPELLEAILAGQREYAKRPDLPLWGALRIVNEYGAEVFDSNNSLSRRDISAFLATDPTLKPTLDKLVLTAWRRLGEHARIVAKLPQEDRSRWAELKNAATPFVRGLLVSAETTFPLPEQAEKAIKKIEALGEVENKLKSGKKK